MSDNKQKFPGIEHLVRLLKLSPAKERRKLLKSIGRQHPDEFAQIYRASFKSEDIAFFSEKQLLEMSDNLDNTVLALNIYELSPDFQEYFLNIMTSFKAKEIQYILDNFTKTQIHKDMDKAKEYLEIFVKDQFLS